MRKDKSYAFALRRKGKSYTEINKIIGVPKSTLSEWLNKKRWSTQIKRKLSKDAIKSGTVALRKLNNTKKSLLTQIYKEGEKEAKKEFEQLKFFPLFLIGISIYWGEGDKISKSLVRISNVDPLLIRIFVRFLKEICGVKKEKIRASVLIYPDLDENICKGYWVGKSELLEKNFNKSILIQGRHKTRRLTYGVCTITVSSTYLKRKIDIWLQMLPQAFLKTKESLFAELV